VPGQYPRVYVATVLYNLLEQVNATEKTGGYGCMRESGYTSMIIVMMVMVALICAAAGCFGFSPKMPGGGREGAGSVEPAASAGTSGGSGTGTGGISGLFPSPGGGGSGAGPSPAGGETTPPTPITETPVFAYFTVQCHSHDQYGTSDRMTSRTDATVTGDIPIEMIREFNDLGMDVWVTTGAKLHIKYTYEEFCAPGDQFCKPCKTTYEGPVLGGAGIERGTSGGANVWQATIDVFGVNEYNDWCDGFDPQGTLCPPRYPLFSQTGEPRIHAPPVQDTCSDGASQDLLYMGIGAPSCSITKEPFVLRDGEVITYSMKNEISENSYESADGTYTFHISAR